MRKPEFKQQPVTSKGSARISVLFPAVVIALGAVILTVVASRPGMRDAEAPTADFAASDELTPAATGADAVAQETKSKRPSVEQVSPTLVQPALAAPSEAERQATSKQLLKGLREVNLRPGELTAEQARKWRQDLLALVDQGQPAYPVLREFFQTNADLKFDSGSAAKVLGEPTLRIAILKVLFDMPGPGNVELQAEVLRNTTDPQEIALLASQLEQQEPGKHRDAILQAAKAALEKTQKGELPGRNPAPLVKVLKQFGDAGPK
jgi:hypothetical protein